MRQKKRKSKMLGLGRVLQSNQRLRDRYGCHCEGSERSLAWLYYKVPAENWVTPPFPGLPNDTQSSQWRNCVFY